MPLRLLLVVGLLLVTSCTTTSPPPSDLPSDPPSEPPVSLPGTSKPTPPQPVPTDSTPPQIQTESEEAPESAAATDSLALSDPLYAETEDALRLAFSDGLFGLYRSEVDPTDAQRLDRTGIEMWLTDLEIASPRAVAFAREMLGPVLAEPFVVGLLLEDAAQSECASIRDVLYVPVPERFQGPERPFNGYIIQDACDLSPGDLAPFCFGGFGTTERGATCSCTCTTGEAPAQPCVSC